MGDYYQGNSVVSGGGFTGEDDTKGKNVQTIIPATIKQLISAEQGEGNSFKIDGKRIYRVKVIGQIMNISKQATTVFIELDDGTGRIDTRYWLTTDNDDEEDDENNNTNSETQDWREGVYVRIFGHVRQFKNSEKNSLVALNIKPIQDFNEITYHLLEATHVHLYNLKTAQDPMNISHQQQQQTSYSNNTDQNPYQQSTNQEVDLQPLYATVLEVVQNASVNSEEGASIAYILEQMSPYAISETEIRGAIQYLSEEGHMYPTFDEEHFKA